LRKQTTGVDVKLPFAMTGTKTTAATFQMANHECSGCFRLGRFGACTHWKAPPSHGAHVNRSLRIAMVDSWGKPAGYCELTVLKCALSARQPIWPPSRRQPMTPPG